MKKVLAIVFLACLLCCAQAQAASVNKVAAVVNGQLITMYDLQSYAFPEMLRMHLNPNNPAQRKQCDQILRTALDQMIMDILFEGEAKRLKMDISDSDVDQEITRMYKSRRMTKQQFEQALAQQNIRLADFRKGIRKRMLRQKIMGSQVGRRVVVTPEEIKAYYEAHKDSMYDRRGLHMAIIAYHPKSPFREIARKVRSGEMPWLEASVKYSVFPKHEKGGDIGPVIWDKLNDDMRARLEKMKPGEVSDLFPVARHPQAGQIYGQVRLFRPNGDQTNRIMTLQEATPMIDAILRDPKAQSRLGDYAEELKRKAVIDIRI
ncbi:MAG: SurA N-terminal domain-containing protein [Desulfovibrio sp.]|nr:SurA N-terminal domain-containing protein [Desulfovibrio sp.]